ncbi:dTMP kinase [Neobacillus sp. Marseille-QA0830]
MNDIKAIYTMAKAVLEDKPFRLDDDYPPIFSIEGLPGAGKTTQIIKATQELGEQFGKPYFIELPTDSVIGMMLRSVYGDQERWEKIRVEAPWMNPLFISIDFQLALQKAKQENADFILMSRGILSTFYYNIGAYMETCGDFEGAWDEISRVLQGFVRPTAIIFLEVPADEAHHRVVKRNRGPLREMDRMESMVSDRVLLEKYIERFNHEIPVHYINAHSDRDTVTNRIKEIISHYMEG